MAGESLQPNRSFLLDTGIIIRYLRKTRQAANLLDFLEQEGEISVSVITYMEILVLCRPHEEESTKLFFDRVPPLAVSQEVAQKAASLIRKYQTVFGKENPRGFPDAIIAATAWHQQATLVTLNTRQFGKASISELAIKIVDQNAKDWATFLKM